MPDYAWVSFATDDGPLGVVFTRMLADEQGDSPLAALLFARRLHRQRLNPGGEVQWVTAPLEAWASQPGWDWLQHHSERLIPTIDLVMVGYLTLSDLGPEGQAQLLAKLAEIADPDTGIQHAEGECSVCDDARTAERLLAEAQPCSDCGRAQNDHHPDCYSCAVPDGA